MFSSQKMKKDFNTSTVRMDCSERLPWESSLLKWQLEITERGHRIFQTERHINRFNRILILKEGLLGKCEQEILQQQMRHLSRSQTSLQTCKILWNITYIQDSGSTIVTCAKLSSLTHPLITVKGFLGKNSLPCGAVHQLFLHTLLLLPSLSSYTIGTLPSYFSPALLLPGHSGLFRWFDLNSQNIEMPLWYDKEISVRGGQEKLGSRVERDIAENRPIWRCDREPHWFMHLQ